MYNRYIPQPDGSFRRSRVENQWQTQNCNYREPPKEEQHCPPENCCPKPQECHCPPQPGPSPCPQHPDSSSCPSSCHKPAEYSRCDRHDSVGGFLRQILPKDFDTGDLIIVLLLLLLAGDCQEDRNTALLTLVLYLVM